MWNIFHNFKSRTLVVISQKICTYRFWNCLLVIILSKASFVWHFKRIATSKKLITYVALPQQYYRLKCINVNTFMNWIAMSSTAHANVFSFTWQFHEFSKPMNISIFLGHRYYPILCSWHARFETGLCCVKFKHKSLHSSLQNCSLT